MSGRRKRGRPVDGILLLNKPQGVTSNGILQRMKRLYGAAKAGHTGALDPLATGLLPIAFGEATKFSQFLLDANKRYITTAKLGIRTDSSDADGQVIEEKAVPQDLTAEQIEALLVEHFTGEIEQVPSMFSALKHNGQPLYKLARKGEKVEVKPRKVTIFEIRLLDFRGDEVDLDIRCSKGTYIRSIVEDLGMLLGCGAHVSMLHRLETGPFKAEQMLTPEQVEQKIADFSAENGEKEIHEILDQLLLPVWSGVIDALDTVKLSESEVARIQNGIAISREHWDAQGVVLMFAQQGEGFYGMGEILEDGRLKPKRLMATGQN